jgi:hypothetical protein
MDEYPSASAAREAALIIEEIISYARESPTGSGFMISVNGKIEPIYSPE